MVKLNEDYKITLDNELRERMKIIVKEMHELYDKRYTPKVKISKRCKACSLNEVCMPRLCKNPSVNYYIQKNLLEGEE